MDSTAMDTQARLLMGLSLGKICRGGGGLRKNLMVATVLQKARLVFMEEAKLARQQLIAPDRTECRVNAPLEDVPCAKSEIEVTKQSYGISEELESRLRIEPALAESGEVSERNNSLSRTTGVKRPCEEKAEVKRMRFSSPSGCKPLPARAPHLQAIAV